MTRGERITITLAILSPLILPIALVGMVCGLVRGAWTRARRSATTWRAAGRLRASRASCGATGSVSPSGPTSPSASGSTSSPTGEDPRMAPSWSRAAPSEMTKAPPLLGVAGQLLEDLKQFNSPGFLESSSGSRLDYRDGDIWRASTTDSRSHLHALRHEPEPDLALPVDRPRVRDLARALQRDADRSRKLLRGRVHRDDTERRPTPCVGHVGVIAPNQP